uniref:Nuf2 domain-containing protein n=1 Tax=Caenorhabditis tropicalis TaxID=1561998 RepID=A0A1I7T0H5_9PELO
MSNQMQVVLTMFDAKIVAKALSQKLQLGLTGENITNPTPEVAQNVLSQFARIILNVPEHSLSTLPLSSNCDFDHELQRKGIPVILVYLSMKAFIRDNSGGKLELTMCDLTMPAKTPNRFRKLASFLHDFIRLHEFATPFFSEICEEFSDRKLEMEEVQEELMAAEKKKNDLLAKQASRKRHENELMNDHNKLKTELNNIVQQYTKNTEITKEVDKQTEETMRQIEEVERETLTGKKTVEHLTEEVLTSPEELKQEMDTRKKHIEELKECLKVSKQSLQSRLQARDICTTAEKNLPVAVEKLQVWSDVRDDILDLIDAVDLNFRKLNELTDDLTINTDKKRNLGERLNEQSQMQEQLRREHMQRTEELQANIEEIKRKISSLGSNQPDVSRDILKKKEELIAIKNAHSETVAKLTNSSVDAMSKFSRIDAQFRETQRVSLEKRNAVHIAKSRVRNACIGRLTSDYTFSTSSMIDSENCDPLSPVESDFSVFN